MSLIKLPDSTLYKNYSGEGLIPRILRALSEINDSDVQPLFKTVEVLNLTRPERIWKNLCPAAYVNLGSPINAWGASTKSTSHPDAFIYNANIEILIALNIPNEVAAETDIRREQMKIHSAVEWSLRRPTDDIPVPGIEPLVTATEPHSELYWQVHIDSGGIWMEEQFIETFKRLGTEIKFEPPYYGSYLRCQWLINNRMNRA